jgi:hypothetical protein
MAILEKVMQMKQQGMNESQIMGSLMQEGISPREINDAISQSQIKSAALDLNQTTYPKNYNESMQNPGQVQSYTMQPSIMDEPENMPLTNSSQDYPSYSEPEQAQVPQFQPPSPSSVPYEEYSEYSGQPYQEYPEYQVPQQTDIETINDLTEQIVDEKIESIKKQLSTLSQLKEETNSKIEILSQRIDKIEKKFDDIQMSIIGRIGDYGRDIEDISREMHATQESFSKILDPLTDNIRKLEKITEGKI